MLSTYDPLKINISFNNRQIRMFGDNIFTLARDEPNASLKIGVKGDGTYVLNANRAGKLTITLQQESPDIPYLENCAESNTRASLAITDANDQSGILFSAQNCMVEKTPDRARAKDAGDVEFVFLIPEMYIKH